jgi:hypothetical protein
MTRRRVESIGASPTVARALLLAGAFAFTVRIVRVLPSALWEWARGA